MSEGFWIEGEIESIGPVQQVSEKFKKAEFTLLVPDGKYPQLLVFQLSGKNTDKIGSFKVGDQATVSFNLRGRRTDSGRCFNTLDVWSVKVTKRSQKKAAPMPDLDANDDFGF